MVAYKKKICIDFDGVIHSYLSGWQGVDHIVDPPVEGAFESLESYIKVFEVMIYSSRSKEPSGIAAMKKWFADYGWPVDQVGDPVGLNFPRVKPPAWLTIDDRCICFNGKFPSIEEVNKFKTWQQRDTVLEYIQNRHNPTVKMINFLRDLLNDDTIEIRCKP